MLNNRKLTTIMLNLFFIVQMVFFVSAINIPIVQVQAEEPSAAQGIVNFYKDVFAYDWELGFEYDEKRDGLGFAQSYDTPGSGYRDFSRAPETITGQMSISPILSPDNSLSETLKLINSAENTLDIQQMYFKNGLDEIVNAIENAIGRGVEVRIIVGNSGSDQEPLDILKGEGATIKVSQPNAAAGNYFDSQHNKGIIVDGMKVLISSINWSPNSIENNREAGVIVENENVAKYYLDLFNYDWGASEDYSAASHFNSESNGFPTPAFSDNNLNINPEKASYTGSFGSPVFTGEMKVTALASPDNCFDYVEALLLNAKHSIEISVYTLSSPYLMDALIDRISNGVKVKLLLDPFQVNFYERNYNRWSMKNLTEFSHGGNYGEGRWASAMSTDENENPAFRFQHSKYCIIDNQTLIISSGNWGRSSCPKPRNYEGEGHANVNGNRDWWFVIYGDGAYVPMDNEYIEVEIGFGNYFILISMIGVILLYKKKRNKRNMPN